MQGLDLSYFLEKDTFLIFGALLLIALTALFSERAGIINIVLEGQLVAGVFGYTFVGFLTKDWSFADANTVRLLLSILGAFVLISAVTLVFAFLTVTIRLDQILVGIALNIVLTAAAAFFILLFKVHSALISQTDYVSLFNQFNSSSYITISYAGRGGITTMLEIFIPLFILLAALPVIYLFLFRTTAGLRIRSCGEKPKTAELLGISVSIYRYLALFIGSCLMVGASVMFIEAQSSFGGSVYGFGYLGLAMLILGNRNIILMTIFTLFFSVFYRLSITLSDLMFTKETWKEETDAMRDFGQELFRSFNFLLPLGCLIIYGLFQRKKMHLRAPESLGK